jgi:hypothetical protein
MSNIKKFKIIYCKIEYVLTENIFLKYIFKLGAMDAMLTEEPIRCLRLADRGCASSIPPRHGNNAADNGC